jgi:hypothetical protein
VEYQRSRPPLNRLFLDIDSGRGWLWGVGPLWDDLLPLVRMEAERLGVMYPLGSIAVIMRSDNGWFIKFPKARLTKEEELSVMWSSMSHFGHLWFSDLIDDTTLRASRKPEKNSHKPYLKEIIQLKGRK